MRLILVNLNLNNEVLPPFKAAAAAGVATFMNSFNTLDGIPATGHKGIQRDLLKEEWNWGGFIFIRLGFNWLK